MSCSFVKPVKFTVFIILIAFGATAASAQESSQPTSTVPTFQEHKAADPAPSTDESKRSKNGEKSVQLKPISPAPTVVVTAAGTAVTGSAKVIPPAPRISVQTAGVVAVPGKRATGTFARRSAAATDLTVNSSYGFRRGRRHNGIDYDGDTGDSVGASMSGTVAFAGVKRGYGNIVILDHGRGIATYYAHLSAIYVSVGQKIEPAQVIGAVGSTGRSTGPHLHYEVRVMGHPIHPMTPITISGDQILINGEPLGGTDAEAPSSAPAVKTSRQAASDETLTRPRRVADAARNGVQKRVLLYGKDSMVGF